MSKDDIVHAKCPVTGLKTVAKTGLVPVTILKAVSERGWLKDEVRGLLPAEAVVAIKNGYAVILGDEKATARPPDKAAA